MRVSQIQVGQNVLVETRGSDAKAVFYNEYTKKCFIEAFGDVAVEFDTKYKVYRVPSFKASIEEFNTIKTADCAKWGCE